MGGDGSLWLDASRGSGATDLYSARTRANIVRTLGKIVSNGHLQQGFKPVHWCLDCSSALAEAEVEYQDKVSSAVDVAFPFADQAAARELLGTDFDGELTVAIWTTTPWTLAANRGVSVAADLITRRSRWPVAVFSLQMP